MGVVCLRFFLSLSPTSVHSNKSKKKKKNPALSFILRNVLSHQPPNFKPVILQVLSEMTTLLKEILKFFTCVLGLSADTGKHLLSTAFISFSYPLLSILRTTLNYREDSGHVYFIANINKDIPIVLSLSI